MNRSDRPAIPQHAVSAFFTKYPGEDGRRLLWNWLRVTVSGTWPALTPGEREVFTAFFDSLEGLVAGSWILLISPPE